MGKQHIDIYDIYPNIAELIQENRELKDELKRCQDIIKKWMNDHSQLIIDNGKMKKAIKILNKFNFKLHQTNKNRTGYEMYIGSLLEYEQLTKEEYELLEEVLGDE